MESLILQMNSILIPEEKMDNMNKNKFKNSVGECGDCVVTVNGGC